MNKQRKTSHILNIFQYDETTGAVTLPSTLDLTAPASNDDSTKVPTTAWVRALASSLGYVTLSTDQSITGLKTIVRVGAAVDVLNFKIGTDTLYGLKIAYNQNELVESGEATWSFASTFNNGSGTGITTTPISFFRGVLVTGQRLLSSSVNANLLEYYGNNPSGRYPVYAYNTGVQQFASSIIVGETSGVVNAATGIIADLPSGVVANFKGRVIGSNAVNSNEFVTLSQLTSGYVNGSGTTNYVSKFTASGSVGNSLIFDNGTNVLIGTTTAPTPVLGVSFPFSVTSSASTRIRIDSTQATPNAGVGLYANGVQKFSFAMFGATSDFTIYNDALLAASILVKGNTNNILIGTSTDNSSKLRVNGTGWFDNTLTATSFVRNGGAATEILAANGSVITAGTGITISGGTISSSVTGGVASFNTRTGAVTLSSGDVTTALGFTPISSYTETDTLASVTGRGATTTTQVSINSGTLQHLILANRFHLIGGSNFHIANNAYFDGVFKYKDSLSPASKLVISGGGALLFDYAATGTIDTAITFTTLFTIGTNGSVTANSFIRSGGTSAQFLMADGSVSTNPGWITGYTETDTLATVTGRGSSTTSQVTISREASINTTTPGTAASYGLHFGGQTTSDLATGITWNGGTTVTNANAGIYVQGSGSYGTRMYIATTDSYASGAKTAITINESGVVTINRNFLQSNTDLRAPIFYDSNNTTYYLDPTSSGTSLYMNGGIVTTAPGGTVLIKHAVSEVDAWIFQENAANWGLYWKNNPSGNHTFGGYTTVGAELFGMSAANSSGNGVTTTNFVGATSAIAQWMISNFTGYVWSASTVFAAGDMRTPVFYDSNDTGYYADFNSTSNSAIRLRGGMLVGPNTTWGAYLQVGGNGHVSASYANVVTTDGNLHLDAATSKAMYLNYYVNGIIYLNGTTYSISSNGSYYNGRAEQVSINYNNDSNSTYQILWGSGNSVYGSAQTYINPSSDDIYSGGYRGSKNVGGTGEASWHPAGIYSGSTQWLYGTTYRNNSTTSGQGWLYFDGNFGYSPVGLYSSTRYQGVFAMGDAYKLPVDGSSPGNLYGITWSHPNAGGVAGNLNTHGALFLENGTFMAAVSGSIRARDDMRAPIFYDSNNTGYYFDGASTSALYDLTIVGAAHKYLYINPGNGYEAMVRYNGGSGSGWYGGKRTSGGINSTADFHFYSEAAAADVFGISTGGTAIASGDMRAPIFYDSNNTGFYTDPNSTSKLSTLNVNNLNSGNVINVGSTNNGGESVATTSARGLELHSVGDRSYWIGKREGAWTQPLDVAFYTGIRYHAHNAYNGHRFFTTGYDSTESFSVGNGDNNVRVSNILFASGDSRAPIFYDISDTGYYLNPNGLSYLYSLELAGGAYFRPRSWIQLDGAYGLYWPNNYGAHFYPNTGSSYTQLRLDGNKNGYGGIWDSYSAVAGMMYDSGGNGGVYREANSRWYFYYHLGNDCMGVGTSSTSSTYSLYLNKGIYAPSRIDATIYYDASNTGYYLDPNGGSYLASSIEIANGYFLTNGVGGTIWMSSAQGSFGGYMRFGQHAVFESINGGYNFYILDASGVGVVKTSGSQSWAAHSDSRIKNIHSVMENNLSKLESISPVYYSFNYFEDNRNRIGLIAQEVQEHFPELVDTDPKTDNLILDYTGLIPVLLGAIKELKNKVEDLESRL
jgi:hypothetical protein